MKNGKQQQSVAIKRGIFLVRYASADDMERPPKVEVSVDRGSVADISLHLHPDRQEAVLWQPDSSLVVRATAPGTLSVHVTPLETGGSAAATVRIEPLSQGQAVNTALKGHSDLRGGPGVRVLGHVTGIGDVTVGANEWIAGPSAPSRIEGLLIDWPDKPAGLDIHYAVKTAKPQPTSGQKMELGAFAGTRGRAMPLVSLMLELTGTRAADFQLSVEAIFLGSPAMRMTGKRIVATGPTGREPLVGLRVGLVGLKDQTVLAKPQEKAAAAKPARPSGRVRVFRSRPTVKEPAKV